MQQQQQQDGHKRRQQPLAAGMEAQLNPALAAKKHRTIEDAIRAAGLDPAQTSKPTITGITMSPYAQPTSSSAAASGYYPSYQFNNYISNNTYPLIGKSLPLLTLPEANYYNYNIVSGAGSSYMPQYQQQQTAPKFMPTLPQKRASGWDKPAAGTSTIEKAINRIAGAQKSERVDILEDKALPDNVRRFIVRGYAKCYTEQERDYMKMLLRQMVDTARATGQLATKRWDEMELPRLPREMVKTTLPANAPRSEVNFVQKMTMTGHTNPLLTFVWCLSYERRRDRQRPSRCPWSM